MPIQVQSIDALRKPQPKYRDTKTPDERRFYGSQEWKRIRERHREEEPLCRACDSRGHVKSGDLVDHIKPIRSGGDPTDELNLQTLCNQCHNKKRQGER